MLARRRPISFPTFYGSIDTNVSRRAVIIGIDVPIISIFPPKSIFDAIALSPQSLHILTANSVNIAIPVIFISKAINSEFIPVLFDRFVKRLIIFDSLSIHKKKIINPDIIEIYIANSGLYCFRIIIIRRLVKPIPYNFYYIHFLTFLIQMYCERPMFSPTNILQSL